MCKDSPSVEQCKTSQIDPHLLRKIYRLTIFSCAYVSMNIHADVIVYYLIFIFNESKCKTE